MPGTVDILLYDCSHSSVRCVSHEAGGGISVGVGEERGIGQGFFCGLEGGQGVIIPMK